MVKCHSGFYGRSAKISYLELYPFDYRTVLVLGSIPGLATYFRFFFR